MWPCALACHSTALQWPSSSGSTLAQRVLEIAKTVGSGGNFFLSDRAHSVGVSTHLGCTAA